MGRGRAGSLPPDVGSESAVGTGSVEGVVSRQRDEAEGWLGGAEHPLSCAAVGLTDTALFQIFAGREK